MKKFQAILDSINMHEIRWYSIHTVGSYLESFKQAQAWKEKTFEYSGDESTKYSLYELIELSLKYGNEYEYLQEELEEIIELAPGQSFTLFHDFPEYVVCLS
jgi:hypothetical protein